ncbi:transposase family protein [Streptomyces canus]|uniref:helix-turn-helix domain-containing protein n=1 Tax=Streptomyces canus TaxID=58343 RepID=UPI0036BA60BC
MVDAFALALPPDELVHGWRWRVRTLIDELVFVDRLLATLVHLRHGATHDVLACWFGVDRSTLTPAIGEVRPLLAVRTSRTPGSWAWSSCWPTGRQWRSWPMPATRGSAHGPAAAAHERHHPGHRRTPLPPADRHPGRQSAQVNPAANARPSTRHRQPCTSSLAPL